MSTRADELEHVPTTGSVRLPPDPRSVEALGRHHSFEAALAELVDNAIDARARHVLIRFERDGPSLIRLVVADDGEGIGKKGIDIAMTVGGRRSYGADEISRFGSGLKAASFSQAQHVTVLSRRRNQPAVGRRWRVERATRDFSCELVEPNYAARALKQDWGYPESPSGTVVRWDNVNAFPAVRDEAETDRFLQATFSRIRTELGMIFHRILAGDRILLFVDVTDQGEGIGARIKVEPLDPFAYRKTGAAGWPKVLSTGGDLPQLKLRCHIWPGRSALDSFRLDGDLIQRQGFYVYFNDRLIQRGGWNGLLHADKKLNLARVQLDIDGDVDGILSLKPEKNGIEAGSAFGDHVLAARARGGSTFRDYIDRARNVLIESNRRHRIRSAVLPPGSGFDPRIRRAIEKELPLKDEDALDIRWAHLDDDDFFEIDRDQQVLWLNQRYRRALLGGRRAGLNDLPVTKALLFLIFENVFAGQNIGPRDRDNLELWQEVLKAAAKAESV